MISANDNHLRSLCRHAERAMMLYGQHSSQAERWKAAAREYQRMVRTFLAE